MFFFTELLKSDAERLANKVVELLHCKNPDTEIIRQQMNSVMLCSELVQEDFRGTIEIKGSIKKVRLDEGWHAGESDVYRRAVVHMLKKQTEMCPTEDKMQLKTAEKEKLFQTVNTSLFGTSEDTERQTVSQTFAGQIFSNEDSPNLST